MGLLRKFFSGSSPSVRFGPGSAAEESDETHQGMAVRLCDGNEDLEVVGESHYQEDLWRIVGGRPPGDVRIRMDIHATLMSEPDNEYDSNAVSVWVSGYKIGYLSRADAERYQPGLLALQQRHGKHIALSGVVVGGGRRPDGPGMLGVFLRHNPADFGLQAPKARPAPAPRMDTGLSEAMATDADDDTYDLSWLDDVSEDPIRAISILRKLLELEGDPIDRHFMFCHLEKALYRSREVFGSALDEYDECCRQHDAEMEIIRGAFMRKWGKVPSLHTYKQMCIRQAKVRDFERALWWAERGLAIYAEDSARPEAVEDLRKRADSYRAKLTPSRSCPEGRRSNGGNNP